VVWTSLGELEIHRAARPLGVRIPRPPPIKLIVYRYDARVFERWITPEEVSLDLFGELKATSN
jgi:hypothetical protein